MQHYQAIVIGCGGLGCATLYRLAGRLGPRVIGIEQFRFGHERGSSQDHSRIIRLAQHQPQYAALAQAAYQAWHEIEKASGQRIVTITGGLVIEDATHRASTRAGTRHIEGYAQLLDRFGVDYTLLEAGEMASRWPQFRFDGGERAIYQRDTGIVDAGRANAVHAALARAHGAHIAENTPVRSVKPTTAGVGVQTDEHTYLADRVVMTSGAWTNPADPRVVVAVGAGHAYKFAALIGIILAELACEGTSSHPIEAFSLARPAITDPAFGNVFHT